MSRSVEELREALEERRRHALRDLEELAEQVDAGDIDEGNAAGLESGYRAELSAVEARLSRLPAPTGVRGRGRARTEAARPGPSAGSAGETAPRSAGPRSTRTVLVAMGAVMVVLSVLIYLAARGGDDEGTAAVPPGTSAATTGDPIADAEALVAAHPESIDLRLQLAGAYFDLGVQQRNTLQDSSQALFAAVQHYAFVWDAAEADDVARAHAGSRLGFLAFETGQMDAAVGFLEEAMELDPDNVEPEWFLGLVLLEGRDDPAGAIPVFENVLARPDLPDWLRDAATDMLNAARAAAGGGE